MRGCSFDSFGLGRRSFFYYLFCFKSTAVKVLFKIVYMRACGFRISIRDASSKLTLTGKRLNLHVFILVGK